MTEREYLLRERECILEFEAGMSRSEAEVKAREQMKEQPSLFEGQKREKHL